MTTATLNVRAATAHRPAMTESYKEDVRNAMQARDGRMLTIVTSPHPSESGIPDNRERTAIKRDISANTSLFSIDRPDFLVPAYWAKAVNAIKAANKVTNDTFMDVSFSILTIEQKYTNSPHRTLCKGCFSSQFSFFEKFLTFLKRLFVCLYLNRIKTLSIYTHYGRN